LGEILPKIPELVKMFEDGEINIPEFQREFVWSDNQVRDLAESIYRGYPIGLLIFYKVPQELKSRNESYWVLDGQQRLLSFVLIMKGQVRTIVGGREKTKRFDIWFDPVNERFELRRPSEGENWVKLSEILQIRKRAELERLLREKGFGPDEQDRISTLWRVFREDYNVPVYELSEDVDLDDLGNIFVRINFAGTRVRGADVYSTMIAIAYPDLVKELRDFCARLPISVDYGILIRTFVAFITDGKVKLASRVFDQARKLKEILKGKKTELANVRREVEKCSLQSIEVLRKFGVNQLPTENVIPVISYYLHKHGILSPEEEKGLFKWFILASFFRRYSASAETRLDEDLETIRNGGNYRDLIENIRRKEGDLKERIIAYIDEGEYDPLLLYALLKQSNAKDLLSGEPITQANSTLHHIFPKKHLAEQGYAELIDDIGNLTLLTHRSNLELSDELPENYLQRVPLEILKTHYMPEDRELWKLEKAKEFVKERKEKLKEAVEKFLSII
jgi:hypothetical protein